MNTLMRGCDEESLRLGAQLIKQGGLVAFPTETVYGLGGDGLNPHAVQAIYAAKGRPADNPLIEHIADYGMLELLVQITPEPARRAMEAFWPGPLTCVLPASARVPRAVTAGLDTVAVRWPEHPVAQALILQAGVPVAAPSANASGRPSPTCAQDVWEDMEGRIPLILDGGPCRVGVESTVVAFSGERPMILRPGGITREALESLLGPVDVHQSALNALQEPSAAPSPGMRHRHYAPKAQVTVVRGPGALERMLAAYDACQAAGGVPWLLISEMARSRCGERRLMSYGEGAAQLAAHLFHSLRLIDAKGATHIYCLAVDPQGMGLAAMNRLLRAADFDVMDPQEEDGR